MQRVRIGLTGLASVFLLVMFAAALLGLARRDEPGAPLDAVANGAAINAVEEDPAEPLAELGVAPGGNPEAEPTSNEAAPPTP